MLELNKSKSFVNEVDKIDITARNPGFTLGPFRLPRFEMGVTVVVGDNGAGKSTFFGALQRHEAYRGVRVAFLPQTFSLPPFSRVRDAFAFVATRRMGGDVSERDAEVERVLSLVGLEGKAKARFRTLSGGMHRRAGLAMTIVGDPELVILDEPTAGLDLNQRGQVLETVSKIAKHTPVLMSSHLSDDLESTASRIVVLDHGRLAFDGPREEYLQHADDTAASAWPSAYRNLTQPTNSTASEKASDSNR